MIQIRAEPWRAAKREKSARSSHESYWRWRHSSGARTFDGKSNSRSRAAVAAAAPRSYSEIG